MVLGSDMKATFDIPDPLFRTVKARAAEQGQTVEQFVTEALQAKLATQSDGEGSADPKWMSGFGKLRRLRKETARVQQSIDEAFEGVASEDR
jgi:hypothetical protein